MTLPFDVNQFLNVFRDYNLSIWPSHLAAYIVGLMAVILVLKRSQYSGRVILFVLSLFWLWNGALYHLIYFARINKAAYLFGSLFIVQGMLYLHFGLKKRVAFSPTMSVQHIVGFVFIIYASIIYPVIGGLIGHAYPYSPLLGVAPCPTTIFTFGILLLAEPAVPLRLFLIPLIWSLIGFNAAWALGIWEDTGLLAAGLISLSFLTYNKYKLRREGIHYLNGVNKCTSK